MMQKPEIKAMFELDDQGEPVVIERGNNKHYKINLSLEDYPEDTYAVTYTLDDSYYEPVREVRQKENKFKESLTSYGDYIVQAKVRTREGVINTSVPLSSALAKGHEIGLSPKIETALLEIRKK